MGKAAFMDSVEKFTPELASARANLMKLIGLKNQNVMCIPDHRF